LGFQREGKVFSPIKKGEKGNVILQKKKTTMFSLERERGELLAN